jgi:hypothetical protein
LFGFINVKKLQNYRPKSESRSSTVESRHIYFGKQGLRETHVTERLLGEPRWRKKDTIKIAFKETGFGNMNWMNKLRDGL